MRRRNRSIGWVRVGPVLLAGILARPAGFLAAEPKGSTTMTRAVRPLADELVKVYESPAPKSVFTYSPGLARCPTGRLVATMDLGGPGVARLPGVKAQRAAGRFCQGKIFTSDDRGRTWTHRADFGFLHARPFVAGRSLYVLGHCNDLMVIRSSDWGRTWSKPARLTDGERWHQAPCNVHYANGCVYLVMERRSKDSKVRGWYVKDIAPVLMRAKVDADLTQRKSWAFASAPTFGQAVDEHHLDYFGVPFYKVHPERGAVVAPGRHCAPAGWLEANVVQFVDPNHYWCDPAGRTFHLWMRAHTGWTNMAAVCKVVEGPDGRMKTMLETVPSGKKALLVPCPGGQMKFHILYDKKTRLYWLLSSQATDSMTRAEKLPRNRYNLPNNERHRLQLHFSRNCIDWCFAGIVAIGPTALQSRHYASMVIDGDDLHVLSRSGDQRAASAHDGNFISFHTIRDFRNLRY